MYNPILIGLVTADESAIGRCDMSSISDQTLIELLVETFENQTEFRDSSGEFLLISDMNVIETDVYGRVLTIKFTSNLSRGTLKMQFFPPFVVEIDLAGNLLSGTFHSAQIPSETRIVLFEENKLEGSVHLELLSTQIMCLHLDENRLSGTLNFCSIPDNLIFLSLWKNKLEGTLDLSGIQRSLFLAYVTTVCDILSGKENAQQNSVLFLDLSANEFTGDITVRDIEKIDSLEIFGELQCGVIVDSKGNRSLLTDNVVEHLA